MWLFMILLVFQSFYGLNCTKDPMFKLSLKDKCIRLCQEEKLPVLRPYFHADIENIICRSGCRLFDIQFGGGLDVSPALKRCQIACEQTFVTEDETIICYIGCNRIASRVQNQIQKVLVMSPQEKSENDLVLSEPESDGMETDLLFDPSIKSQLEVGFNIDYKIPETHIRTMPIEDKSQITSVVVLKQKDTGDWLDCASKNSGIPRWILLSTMLGAIMVAIWLTLSMESRKGNEEGDDEMLVEVPDKTHMETFIIEKDASLLEGDASETNRIHIEFLPPPKYSEVNELDHSEPPNYADAVENQKRESNA